jgi:mRNA interferase MazF
MTRTAPPGWFPRRGEIYWIKVDKRRPAMVMSTEALNRHALDVCVVPLTTVEHKRFSLRVPIRAGEGGLPSDSWAKCDRITTVEKTVLVYPPLGRVGSSTLEKIEQGVKLALELT